MAARHPPLAPGWIDRPHLAFEAGDLALESGETLRECRVSYVMHGELDAARSNAIVVLTAIGSTHHRLDFLIGPGRALDPVLHCIIAIDALGNGLSSSPSNSRAQPGLAFPNFTIRDMVASQARLLQHLGIDRAQAIVGASMGGMQVLQWGTSYPGMAARLVAMTPMAKTHPWARLVNETARRMLTAREDWAQATGEAHAWEGWVPFMQFVTGRTPDAVPSSFGTSIGLRAAIEERVAAQAAGSAPIDWYYQSLAYDAHDVGETPGFGGDTAKALASIRARTLILAPPLDLYNPATSAREASDAIPGARFVEIPSRMGHQSASGVDADDAAFLNREIGKFLASGA